MKTSKRILAAAILICICMPMAFSYFRATAFRQIRESTNCFDSTDIRERQLGIINVDDTLVIRAYIQGRQEVEKCGFKKIMIQRRPKGQENWATYKVYRHLYTDGNECIFQKKQDVEAGYQYRVVATYYTKRNLFVSSQENEVTGALSF